MVSTPHDYRQVIGCLPFSTKIWKFRLKVKWNSYFPENPFGKCTPPPEEVLFFRSERNDGNSLLVFGKFSSFQSLVNHQPKTITRNRIANGKRHLIVRLFDDFGKTLTTICSRYPNWFILTNGHPASGAPLFCFYLNGKHSSFTKRFRFSVFRSQPGDFKYLRFEERFRKFPFSWRISVDGRPVEIKPCFRDGLVWTVGLTVEIKLRFRDGLVWMVGLTNKAVFSWWISVDGRSNRRNKAAFFNFSSVARRGLARNRYPQDPNTVEPRFNETLFN